MGKVILTLFVVFLYALLVTLPKCDAMLLHVEGNVYCDTCRIQTMTKISQPIADAEVELTCVSRLSGQPLGSKRVRTAQDGRYMILAEGAFEKDDSCHVTAISSPRLDCNELMDEHNRVVPTTIVGYSGERRYAKPVGFMIKDPLPQCKQVMSEVGIKVGTE